MSGASVDGAPEDRGLRLITRLTLTLVVVAPNVVGAGVVLFVAAWVLPVESLVRSDTEILMRNIIAFGAYLLGAVLVGVLWGTSGCGSRGPRARTPTTTPSSATASGSDVWCCAARCAWPPSRPSSGSSRPWCSC